MDTRECTLLAWLDRAWLATSAARATSPGSADAGSTSIPAALSTAHAAVCSAQSTVVESAAAAAYDDAARAATSAAEPDPPGNSSSIEVAIAAMKRAVGELGESSRTPPAGSGSSTTETFGRWPSSLWRRVRPAHCCGAAPSGPVQSKSTEKEPAQPFPGTAVLWRG